MTLHQQMTISQETNSAQLVIKSDPNGIPELNALAYELSQRQNMVTDGNITILAPEPPPIEG